MGNTTKGSSQGMNQNRTKGVVAVADVAANIWLADED